MKAIIVKKGKLSDYSGDILIDGKIIKSENLETVCEKYNIKIVIAKSMPSSLIKRLREKNILFLKLNSLDEIDDINLDIIINKEFKNKRGWKCGKKGF